MLNLAAKVIGVPLMKVAGSEAAAKTVKTVTKEGGEQVNIAIKDVFQRYGAANQAGIVSGGKFFAPKARLQLFGLRMKAIGKLFGELLGKLKGKFSRNTASAAEKAGKKAEAQAEALKQQAASGTEAAPKK